MFVGKPRPTPCRGLINNRPNLFIDWSFAFNEHSLYRIVWDPLPSGSKASLSKIIGLLCKWILQFDGKRGPESFLERLDKFIKALIIAQNEVVKAMPWQRLFMVWKHESQAKFIQRCPHTVQMTVFTLLVSLSPSNIGRNWAQKFRNVPKRNLI